MTKKCTVYTRTGDAGLTSLASGDRVPKDSLRLEAYGTVDELNSQLGLLLTFLEQEDDRCQVLRCQNLLFTVGASLAMAWTEKGKPSALSGQLDVAQLEQAIDKTAEDLPKLRGFTLPGGCRASAVADVCRTVCRRAERRVFTLSQKEIVAPEILVLLNRLSDYLYVLSRRLNKLAGVEEILWTKISE